MQGGDARSSVTSHSLNKRKVIPLISQFMSVSDKFSFLREEQKEAVRSERLNSKAKEFCNKEGLFRKGR